MLIVKEALELTSVEAVTIEITQRRGLIGQMVGSLYPAILEAEIETLIERIKELQKETT